MMRKSTRVAQTERATESVIDTTTVENLSDVFVRKSRRSSCRRIGASPKLIFTIGRLLQTYTIQKITDPIPPKTKTRNKALRTENFNNLGAADVRISPGKDS